jgi:hypothetical protein
VNNSTVEATVCNTGLVQRDRVRLGLTFDIELVERALDDLTPRPAAGESELRIPGRNRYVVRSLDIPEAGTPLEFGEDRITEAGDVAVSEPDLSVPSPSDGVV